MSDYYRRRRVMIKDATALMTFFIAFFWAGAFAWPVLANGVDDGEMTRGLAYFLSAVLGSALVAGLLGLETGNLLGGAWERYHREHRSLAFGGLGQTGGSAISSTRGPAEWTRPSGPPAIAATRPDPTQVYYSREGVYAASYVKLSDSARPDRYELRRIRAALAKTINVGAWDDGRLVGAVRVLTDGYTFSAVADIVVDPEYQNLGIGRRLMREALAVAPEGRLFVEALPACSGFFERVGCERGPTGFLLTNQTGIT